MLARGDYRNQEKILLLNNSLMKFYGYMNLPNTPTSGSMRQ